MEPSPYSERFTIACNHSREPTGGGGGGGEVPGVVHLRVGPVFFLYGPMLRCRTYGEMAEDLGAVDLRGRDPLR